MKIIIIIITSLFIVDGIFNSTTINFQYGPLKTLPYAKPLILLLLFYKYSYLSKNINHLCLDKGTEGKHNWFYFILFFEGTWRRGSYFYVQLSPFPSVTNLQCRDETIRSTHDTDNNCKNTNIHNIHILLFMITTEECCD